MEVNPRFLPTFYPRFADGVLPPTPRELVVVAVQDAFRARVAGLRNMTLGRVVQPFCQRLAEMMAWLSTQLLATLGPSRLG